MQLLFMFIEHFILTTPCLLTWQHEMADSLSSTVRTLISTLSSSSAHRGALATQLASDLYSLCVESVSDTELGNFLSGLFLGGVYCMFFLAAYCSSVLFHKDSGILHFLKESATLDEVPSLVGKLRD